MQQRKKARGERKKDAMPERKRKLKRQRDIKGREGEF